MEKTAAQQAAAPQQDRRTPSQIAVEHLAKLASQGAAAPKMVLAVDGVLFKWAAEGLPPFDLSERLEALQGEIDAGAQAAEDFSAEADTEAGKAAAVKQMAGLRAVQDRIAAVIAG